MLAVEVISNDLPLLRPTDTVEQALEWMDEFKVTHLPVTENEIFYGSVEESSLLNAENAKEIIQFLQSEFVLAYVNTYDHVFEVVKNVSDFRLSVIPVLDEQKRYVGSISIHNLMEVIADMPVVKNPGSILVLEMSLSDYSLFEVARIVESNGAKILGTFITRFFESTKMELTVKINREDIRDIIQSFERYNYTITATYDKGDDKKDLKERYDHLMNYLKM